MKAVVVENYDAIDGISIKEMPMPAVSAGEVRVKIGAAAVGFVDGLKVQGLYQTKDPLPFVPGTEFSGVVDATAYDVTAFRPSIDRYCSSVSTIRWSESRVSVSSRATMARAFSMMIFLIILVVGFIYEWKKGALEWE